ncbi:MAG: hypothetical protein Q4B14_01325 [Clostridia bacterium]|nr:hypothetical protein [Clostridia bacterium]
MKKSVLFLSLAFLILSSSILVACSNKSGNSDVSTQSKINSSASLTSSQVLNSSSDTENKVASMTIKDFDEWTYEDWDCADDDSKEACRKYFSDQLSQNTNTENLSKIFATNQDKTLSEIIKNQKAIINDNNFDNVGDSDQFVQPDPGHGAAAGY